MRSLMKHTGRALNQVNARGLGKKSKWQMLFAVLFATCLIVSVIGCGGVTAANPLAGANSTPSPTPAPTGSPTPSATPTPVPASLAVSPRAANVTLGSSQSFAATGTASPVNWSVNGIPGGNSTIGTISAAGLYVPPAVFPATNNFAVTATSQANPSVSASAIVLVVYPNVNGGIQSLPIKLGVSGGNALDVTADCCTGTLGSLVDRGGLLYVLSNNHILARSSFGVPGEAINQPGSAACFATNSQVASLQFQSTIIPTTASNGIAPSNVDAALAQISPGAVDTAGTILDLGPAGPTSIAAAPPSATLAVPALGMSVAKSGRTTGLTCSTITSVSTSVSVDYSSFCGGPTAFTARYVGQVVVGGSNFSAPGDSGSLLVTTDLARPVALLFAGSGTSTVANPIQDVMFEFTVPTRNPPIGASIVGGPDHLVSCQPTATNASSLQPAIPGDGVQTLSAQERLRVEGVHQAHSLLLMRDPAVAAVSIGASEDSPNEGALIIRLSGTANTAVPAVIDGVRTRVLAETQDAAAARLLVTQKDIDRAMLVKEGHVNDLLSWAGIQGLGVAVSKDNPAEPAVVIYVVRGVSHPSIPVTLGGIRTQVIEGERFRAY
jgi:hypothetical protein